MKIAILMSTYNGHQYLGAQLESLSKQTVSEDITVYIRDDGSADDTFDIIERWKKKLNIVLYRGNNAGPAKSFWKLLMDPEIHADYYAFCDQDDVWDEDKIEAAIRQLYGNTHLYACNCRIINEDGVTTKELRVTEEPEITMKRLFVTGCTQGCSMVFTDALRNYMEIMDIQCIPMHDVVLMLYAMQFGSIYWDQIPRFGYRIHSNNVVAKDNKSKMKQIKTTIWNWKNSSKNSMSEVAGEMLEKIGTLSKAEASFLKEIQDYRKNKIKVINECRNVRVGKEALKSFEIRVLMGLY